MHRAQPLEFAFAADVFTLEIQHTEDGARTARELEQQRTDRMIAESNQLPIEAPLELIAEILSRRGFLASHEHPGFIQVPVTPDSVLCFGFANGCLGWDLVTPDGETTRCGQEATLTQASGLDRLIARIADVIHDPYGNTTPDAMHSSVG